MNQKVALITGASSGIGKSLALELAREKWAVVLVSRDPGALRKVAEECEKLSGRESHFFPQDLTSQDAGQKVLSFLKAQGLEIDLLVNNAGFGVHGDFLTTDLQSELSLVQIQIGIFLELTKGVLPPMVKRKQGAILNIASVYSFWAVPFQAVYGASKAFMLQFSLALANELKSSGIQVTTICPGATRTEFRKRIGIPEKSSGQSAEFVARFALRALEQKKLVAVPGLTNRIFVCLSFIIPRAWQAPILRRINQRRGLGSASPD